MRSTPDARWPEQAPQSSTAPSSANELRTSARRRTSTRGSLPRVRSAQVPRFRGRGDPAAPADPFPARDGEEVCSTLQRRAYRMLSIGESLRDERCVATPKRGFESRLRDSSGTHVASLQNEMPDLRGFLEADEGTRTLELLDGECSRPFAPVRARSLKPLVSGFPIGRANASEPERTPNLAILATDFRRRARPFTSCRRRRGRARSPGDRRSSRSSRR
jgi:hypothetical protein